MMIKEKTAERAAAERNIRASSGKERTAAVSRAVRTALCCAAGFMLSGAAGSGGGIPLCVPLIAVLLPFEGMCVFAGAAAAYLISGKTGLFLTDIAAMPLLLGIRCLSKKPFSQRAAALSSGIVYIIAGIAASFASRITGTLIAAVIFRGVICGAASYFAAGCAEEARNDGRISVTGEKAAGTAVLYVLVTAALVTVSFGSFCPARAAGIFVILAAGELAGAGGAAAAGVLSAAGIMLGESRGADLSGMVRGSVITACSGIFAGAFSGKSRLSSAAAFSASVLTLTLFMGRTSQAAALLTDAAAAAALYCIIPDRMYRRVLNSTVKKGGSPEKFLSGTLLLASGSVNSINADIAKASGILAEINGGRAYDPVSDVCVSVCGNCRNSDFCCKGSLYRRKNVIPEAFRIIRERGHITGGELPKALESCGKKEELTEALCRSFRRAALEMSEDGFSAQLRENMSEQLSALGDMLSGMGSETDGMEYDGVLSEKAGGIIAAFCGEKPDTSVFYDSAGHVFISCFCRKLPDILMEKLTEKLSVLTDRGLEAPEAFTENGVTRLRWHEETDLAYESGKAMLCGREGVSGDASAEFRDGLGNVYFIISDGMGSGSRAAIESSMTVSLLARLIKSGTGAEAALKLVNLILLSKSPEEMLSTADILKINLFTGRTEIIKAGAPQTFFRSGGTVKTAECSTRPLGMIVPALTEKKQLRLGDGDCAVMISDGVAPGSFPKIRELVLTDGFSPLQCAEAVVKDELPEGKYPADDRTVIVVKLHKL